MNASLEEATDIQPPTSFKNLNLLNRFLLPSFSSIAPPGLDNLRVFSSWGFSPRLLTIASSRLGIEIINLDCDFVI